MPPDPCPVPNGGSLPVTHIKSRVLGRIRGHRILRHGAHHAPADPAFAHIPAEPASLGDSCFKHAPSLGRPKLPAAVTPFVSAKVVAIAGGVSLAGAGGVAGMIGSGHGPGSPGPGHTAMPPGGVNVPEPASLALLGAGLIAVVILRLRRRRPFTTRGS